MVPYKEPGVDDESQKLDSKFEDDSDGGVGEVDMQRGGNPKDALSDLQGKRAARIESEEKGEFKLRCGLTVVWVALTAFATLCTLNTFLSLLKADPAPAPTSLRATLPVGTFERIVDSTPSSPGRIALGFAAVALVTQMIYTTGILLKGVARRADPESPSESKKDKRGVSDLVDSLAQLMTQLIERVGLGKRD